jgi:nucleoside-diphosphate-sugar epimerase
MKTAVTGAFGYSGRYIASRLLQAGHSVMTLTNSLQRKNPFGDKVRAFLLQFDQPDRLRESLQGVDVLINTYWVRFDHRLFSHQEAVTNTKIMFRAAKDAGVRRIVHVVITREEIRGLMEGRLSVDALPLGTTKLTEWIRRHRDTLGRHYTSEMARRIDRFSEYRSN